MVKKYTTLMIKGSLVCIVSCFFLIWRITFTGDASTEWMVYVLLLIGFCLYGVAYIKEKMSRTIIPPLW